MNIVYLHTHDTGRYIQPYGYAIPTPNLQRFAETGTIFRQCFNAGPTCSPSRAALLTGQYPHQCGMIGLAHRGFALSDYSRHLASYLTRSGYETVLCGVQHEAPWKRRDELGYVRILADDGAGWRETKTEQEKGANLMAQDRINARLSADYIAQPHTKPFFLSFGMISTHRPYPAAAPDIKPEYTQSPSPVFDNSESRRDMAEFATMARCVDDCVGQVLSALSQSGHDKDTLVLFTTDHGIAFPKMKCHLYDSGIGVALIVKRPGAVASGNAIDALVSHVDLFPTICDAAGVSKPEWLEGVSLIPLLDGTVQKVRDEIFSEVTYHAAYEPMRCIRTERYKYIRYFDDTMGLVVKPNIDDGYSKQFLMRHGLMEHTHDSAEMLFDLYYDPTERANLVADKKYRSELENMRTRLDAWMKRTNDPLLQGPVSRPAGAVANNRRGVQPSDSDWET